MHRLSSARCDVLPPRASISPSPGWPGGGSSEHRSQVEVEREREFELEELSKDGGV